MLKKFKEIFGKKIGELLIILVNEILLYGNRNCINNRLICKKTKIVQ